MFSLNVNWDDFPSPASVAMIRISAGRLYFLRVVSEVLWKVCF